LFFPHQIGDRWEYRFYDSPQIYRRTITRDSIGQNGEIFIEYNNSGEWSVTVDTNDYLAYSFCRPYPPFYRFLDYKLDADSGDVWYWDQRYPGFTYAWVFEVQGSGNNTIKKIRYAHAHPDSGGATFYVIERHIAYGFGLIWEWREPDYVTYLAGAIISGDTFGIITDISVDEDKKEIKPSNFILSMNYPNPFNPSTDFDVTLYENMNISLEIYNSLGQKVNKLFEGRRHAGIHHFSFQATGLPSGIYIIKLTTNSGTQTRKVLLLK
jgi:hypothetical protein